VVGRQLCFPGVKRATKESEFGSVSSTFSMDNVKCKGNETAVTDCYHKTVMVLRLLVLCVPRILLIFLMTAGRMTNCAWWEEPLAQAMFTMVVTLSVNK